MRYGAYGKARLVADEADRRPGAHRQIAAPLATNLFEWQPAMYQRVTHFVRTISIIFNWCVFRS